MDKLCASYISSAGLYPHALDFAESKNSGRVKLRMLFISYSSDDRLYVRTLSGKLQALGVELWFDSQQIKPGGSIPMAISEGLAVSKKLLVVWSQASKSSVHVNNELDAFYIKSPNPESILFLKLDTQPIPTLYAARQYICSSGDIENDATLVRTWIDSSAAIASHLQQEPERDMTPANIPKGPRVERYLISDSLVAAYAEGLPTRTKAEQIIGRAMRLRRSADPGDRNATTFTSGDLPNLDVVGADAFWQDVFTQAALHGPRMLGALLLAQPDDLFPAEARSERARLLLYLRTGIRPELQH